MNKRLREDGQKIEDPFEMDKEDNDVILNAYRLAKRKEEALKKLNDDNIRVFAGEDVPERYSVPILKEKLMLQNEEEDSKKQDFSYSAPPNERLLDF